MPVIAERSSLLNPHQHLLLWLFFYLSYSLRCAVVSHGGFNLHFSNDLWFWTLFTSLFATCYLFSERFFVCLFLHIFLIDLFLYCWTLKLFTYSGHNILVKYVVCKYFPSVSSLSSSSNRLFFSQQKVLIPMKSNLKIFSFS